jgi:hypothetical protein
MEYRTNHNTFAITFYCAEVALHDFDYCVCYKTTFQPRRKDTACAPNDYHFDVNNEPPSKAIVAPL